MTRGRALWLMIAVLLVASLLRLPDLQSAPPGLHFDEAANAIIAREIGLGGERPVFIESYTGKEVLFFYLAGALMAFVQPSLFVLRLTSALIGLLTIAATYWLGRELLADRRVAVIAAALVAISFWHLMFSRLGFRAISQPLLQALAVATLFRGLKSYSGSGSAWKWFLACGIFLGLTAYTYLAARLFPVPLALALLPVLSTREGIERRWRLLVITGAAALVILAPLLIYFVQNPETFWVRIVQVAPGGATTGHGTTLGESYLRSLGMYFLSGDPYWRFNIPGKPLFNWFWGGLLVVGWLMALGRWRRWWYDWQKSAVLLLLSTPFLMLLPTALAIGEIVPSNLRAIGLIPFIFYLPALGLVTLVEQLADLVRRPGERLTAFLRYLNFLEGYDVNYAFFVLLILILGGMFTWRTYFEAWAMRSDVFYSSDADLVAVAEYLDTRAPQDVPVYVAALHYRHPTIAFLASSYERVKWLTASKAIVFPAQGEAHYVFPANSPAPEWTEPYLASAQRIVGPEGPDGEPLYVAYHLEDPEDVRALSEVELTGSFNGLAQPLWHHNGAGESGKTLSMTLAWRVLHTDSTPLRLFVHMNDIWGHRWSQTELLSYAVEQWQPGDIVLQHVDVPVPAGTPPGEYELRVGFFNEVTGARLPRLDTEGHYAGDALVIGGVTVTSGAAPQAPPQAPRGRPQHVRDGLELLGYGIAPTVVETGAKLPLALWWWATEKQPRMTVRLELLRADDTGIILLNTQPVQSTYPFENWRVPLFLQDVIDPRIPVDLEAGDYRLHLRLLGESGETVFTSSLGTVTVQETVRNFTVPDLNRTLDASFAGEIALLGYNLQQTASREFRLQLAWRALRQMEQDYTVFVHLLRQDGSCCLWQSDAMPRQGQYPTSRWVQGEVVIDEYILSLPDDAPPGEYVLELGFYLAESGKRLVLDEPAGRGAEDALLLPSLTLE